MTFKRSTTIVMGGLLLGTGLLVGSLSGREGSGSIPATAPPATVARVQAVETPRMSYAAIVEPAIRAVVSIHSTEDVSSREPGNAPEIPDLFRRYFGDQFGFGDGFNFEDQLPQQRPREGQGSGVIVDPSGYILTNAHVVENASRIRVRLSDRREFDATVSGIDTQTDLALLKIEAEALPTLEFGRSADLRVGDVVFAIGNPFGVGQTVTMGIVSATGRGNLGIEDYEDFVQTDAAINPGNSGGALLDSNGSLIGINTAIVGSGGNDGVGFAIPAQMALRVMNDLRTDGTVSRGRIGIVVQDMTPDLAQAMDLSGDTGALVSEVAPDSPAVRAGIERGDVITSLDGNPVVDARQLRLRVGEMKPGTEIALGLVRGNRHVDLQATLAAVDSPQSAPARASGHEERWGMALEPLDATSRSALGLGPSADGVVIRSVEPDSPAYRAGLQPGDLIVETDHVPVRSVSELRDRLSEHSGPVLLLINRRGTTTFAVMHPR